jgi:hypothetical protein
VEAGTQTLAPALRPPHIPAAPAAPEPATPAEIRALVHAGWNESDAAETVLAQSARFLGALELAIGDGLLALEVGDRLVSLGFSSAKDYARERLDVRERTAQAMARLARELRTRPRLRAAVRAGEVRVRAAQTVLPVARGEAEAEWVERARHETVRALEKAVRAARVGGDEGDEEWTTLRVRLSAEDRATVDEALAVAGAVLPGARRPERLEAMAQEYLGEHPEEPREAPATTPFRRDPDRLDRYEAALEAETERWSYLAQPGDVPVPDARFEESTSAEEIDLALRALAERRDGWDRLVGWCAWAVRRSGLWRIAGFASFEHYCEERLGLSARAVEQRALVERRLWEIPALRAARDEGLSFEKVRLLARLPTVELPRWLPRARALTCVALAAALEGRDEAQMRAARSLRARMPERIAAVLQDAFRAVRAAEGRLLDDGRCLARVARHFLETWRAQAKKARTPSQKVRERDLGRCQVPGCSRRAVHAHHIEPRCRGGSDEPENLVALCACHHLRGIHGGHMKVWGRAPHGLFWAVRGEIWTDGRCSGGALPGARAA